MTQAIVAGLVGLLAGFGLGNITQWDDADDMARMGAGNGRMASVRHEEPLPNDYLTLRPSIEAAAVEELSAEELADLEYMREEEKLARDVYTTLYEQWQTPIFSNIARSEQTHTEAVRQLLEKYDVADPVVDDTVGMFTNAELQELYDNLVTEGSASLEAALRVGATIEDLDIKDLNEALQRTNNADITLVYENLRRGSRNHLRSFTMQLERLGVTYEPQYISGGEYEAIVGSEHERGGQTTGWGSGGQRGNGGGGRRQR